MYKSRKSSKSKRQLLGSDPEPEPEPDDETGAALLLPLPEALADLLADPLLLPESFFDGSAPLRIGTQCSVKLWDTVVRSHLQPKHTITRPTWVRTHWRCVVGLYVSEQPVEREQARAATRRVVKWDRWRAIKELGAVLMLKRALAVDPDLARALRLNKQVGTSQELSNLASSRYI